MLFVIKNHMNYSKNNIFYKIINSELPSNKIYEDDKFLAILDQYPKYQTHILLMPKKEFISIDDFLQNSSLETIGKYFFLISKIAKDHGLSENGYKVLTNHKSNMGQEIFHFHTHIMAGEKL